MQMKRLLLMAGVAVVAALVFTAYQERVHRDEQEIASSAALEKGMSQFRDEQYKAALETLNGIQGTYVNDWRIPYYAGSSLIKLKDYQGAAPRLERARELNPQEENVLFALGVVYYKLGNLSLSRGYFAAVLEINPGHEEARGLMDIMAGLERYNRKDDVGKDKQGS